MTRHTCSKSLGRHGCAECLRNRVYDKRVWCHRMDLESRCHSENSFLTLTYDDDNLPPGGSLDYSHTRNWLKSFRQEIYPLRIRYFLVGEYGELSLRPHYHAALFGVGPQFEDAVRKTWKKGHVMLAELNIATIRYIAGYVTKKYKQNDEDYAALGLVPEDRFMSIGLGRDYAKNIADALDCEQSEQLGDVPTSLLLHGRPAPLGRYMRSKIRQEVFDNDSSSHSRSVLQATTQSRVATRILKNDAKMLSLYKDYEASSISSKMTFLEFLAVRDRQLKMNTEATFKLNHKGSL